MFLGKLLICNVVLALLSYNDGHRSPRPILAAVTCDVGQEVVVKDCIKPTKCFQKSGKVVGQQTRDGVLYISVKQNGGLAQVPSWNVMWNGASCGHAQPLGTALSGSALFWGVRLVQPWIDAIAEKMPLRKLLILPLREYGLLVGQRSTNRGDVTCLLPVLAAQRWPKLRITIWEQVPEFADLCRRVLAHNEVRESVEVVSVSVPELIHMKKSFDAVILFGNERPSFEAYTTAGGLNFLLSTVRVLHDMASHNRHPLRTAHIIPKLAAIVCAPVAASFLRGMQIHFGFNLSLWPVPREVPIKFNLWELQSNMVATPSEVVQLEFGGSKVKSNQILKFDLGSQRVDALACWPNYKVKENTELWRENAPAQETAQVLYLLKQSRSGLESITLHTEVTVERGLHFRIPSLLNTASPSQKRKKLDVYHWWMIHDEQRGTAYNEAIRKLILPNQVVVDVGTGSGLLAMMALREGAAHAHAFETEADHARFAEKIVGRNGFAAQVTIHRRMSTNVSNIAELGWSSRADALVTETFGGSADGLAEGIIDTIAHARRVLLKPGAVVIPAKLRVYGQLAELPRTALNAAGADVRTPFLEFQPQLAPQWPREMMNSHERLSDPFVVANVNFMMQDMVFSDMVSITATVTRNGTVHGALVWFELDLDPEGEIRISSKPGEQPQKFAPFREEHWRTALTPFYLGDGESKKVMAPVEVHVGDIVSFIARRDTSKIDLLLGGIRRIENEGQSKKHFATEL